MTVQQALESMGLLFDVPEEVRNLEVQPVTKENYEQWFVDAANQTSGDMQGFFCEKCRNKGYIVKLKDGNEIVTAECECMKQRRITAHAKKSGLWHTLSRMQFDTFICKTDWQAHIKQIAVRYAAQKTGWFFIGGQTGAGKTHICTAISGEMLKSGLSLQYLLWRELLHQFQAVQWDHTQYKEQMQELMDVDVLYIDDFLKSHRHTDTELNIAFEVINGRYISRKPTIISSEMTLSDIYNADEAIAGRIREMCGENVIAISADTKKNIRLNAM